MAGFPFRLELVNGVPAEPATIEVAVPNMRAGDSGWPRVGSIDAARPSAREKWVYGRSGIRSMWIRVPVTVARNPPTTRFPFGSNRFEIETVVNESPSGASRTFSLILCVPRNVPVGSNLKKTCVSA